MSLRWSLASQQIVGGGYIHRASHRLSRPVCRFFGGLLLPSVCCFCGLAGIFPSSRYITGTLCIAIDVPFTLSCVFNYLRQRLTGKCFDSSKLHTATFNKQ